MDVQVVLRVYFQLDNWQMLQCQVTEFSSPCRSKHLHSRTVDGASRSRQV